MKFYRYPLALIAYALLFIFLLAWGWHQLAGQSMATYWYYFPAGAGVFLLISFLLSKLKLHWELDVLLQVMVVLAPVLWYVNQREPYKRPVYIFVTNPVYSGKLTIRFNHDKNAKTNANNPSDTLYFKFDEDGSILLNEDGEYVRECMRKRLYTVFPDQSRKLVPFADKNHLPSDTLTKVLVEDTLIAEKGRMKELRYRIDFPQKLKR